MNKRKILSQICNSCNRHTILAKFKLFLFELIWFLLSQKFSFVFAKYTLSCTFQLFFACMSDLISICCNGCSTITVCYVFNLKNSSHGTPVYFVGHVRVG